MRVRIEKEKRIRGRIRKQRAEKLSRAYNKQACYVIQYYDPKKKIPVGLIPVRTEPTLRAVLKDLEKKGLYPLILPQPVYVPKAFWEEYRYCKDKVELAKNFELLKDSSIHQYKTVIIDVDSHFESVYEAWNELKEALSLQTGYQVYRTKSGRFRAYIYLDGTKDLKRAKELLAIIYAYFESKGFNADHTFVYRLNHPVFYEEFPLYNYKLIEDVEGEVKFFDLYRKVKKLQKELELYTFKGKNITEEIWGKKNPKGKKEKEENKDCRIIKAPAFLRKIKNELLDVLDLWKQSVTSLFRKHGAYRYIHVIQPAIGWAKYLELPEDEVRTFLIELLGGEKEKDIEKGFKYARELEFIVPESVKWAGKTREEWEGRVIAYLNGKRRVNRQELIKNVFHNQKWLCDLIMDGLVKKGMVISGFEVYGRGRPRKVYELAEEMRIPLREAVGCEEIIQAGLELSAASYNKEKFVVGDDSDFSQNNNSLSLRERAMGGGWYEKKGEREREVKRSLKREVFNEGGCFISVSALMRVGFDSEDCDGGSSDRFFDCWDDVIGKVFDEFSDGLSWSFVDCSLSDGWSSCSTFVDYVTEDCSDFESDGDFWEEGLFEF